MQTIRTFSNVAEAGLACSVLEAAGIHADLADENGFTLGPQYVPWGIRLQVPEPDADRAGRVLDHQEGFTPLPDDFVPPAEPAEESAAPTEDAKGGIDAFLRGGILALAIFGVYAMTNLATGHPAHADPGAVFLLFALGGVAGIFLRPINAKARGESEKSRKGTAEAEPDED